MKSERKNKQEIAKEYIKWKLSVYKKIPCLDCVVRPVCFTESDIPAYLYCVRKICRRYIEWQKGLTNFPTAGFKDIKWQDTMELYTKLRKFFESTFTDKKRNGRRKIRRTRR